MQSRLEGLACHLVMGVMHGQVDDDVDLGIGQQVVEGSVRPAAMLGGECGRAGRVQVGHRHEPDLRVGRRVTRVSAGDVAGPDDADTKRGHGRRLRHPAEPEAPFAQGRRCRMVGS